MAKIPKSFAGELFKGSPWIFERTNVVVNSLHIDVVTDVIQSVPLLECKKCTDLFCRANLVVAPKSSFHSQIIDEKKVRLFFLGPCSIDGDLGAKKIIMEMAKELGLDNSEFIYVPLMRCFTGESISGEQQQLVSQNCLEHLEDEVRRARPDVVIALGASVSNFLLGKKEKITKIHGELFSKDLTGGDLSFRWMPSFHPEMIQINKKIKDTVWLDLAKIKF